MTQEPLFSCSNEHCRVEHSYPAGMLRLAPDGRVICDGCWDEERGADDPEWSDLRPFVPAHEETIAALLEALIGMLRVCPRERNGMVLAEYEAARAAIARARGEAS